MTYDVIIIGAGPAGLACARVTAAHGLKTLVLERKETLGKKVCAGGITWNGLLKKVPIDISERQFCEQIIFTRRQTARVTAPTPIIATVNRQKLGLEMAQQATREGAEIHLGCQVTAIHQNSVYCTHKGSARTAHYSYAHLVGADGSSSLVRRTLGLPVIATGIGITYQIPGDFPNMEWHLDSSLFANGYAWVFPHKDSASIGAYVDARIMKAGRLKASLLQWGEHRGYPLRHNQPSAELINFDFRGWRFANSYLVGDAAGLASGLTGEGIYPAIVSGETVGEYIADPHCNLSALRNLIKNHKMHARMVSLTGKSSALASCFSECLVFCLKKKLLDFSAAEMAR